MKFRPFLEESIAVVDKLSPCVLDCQGQPEQGSKLQPVRQGSGHTHSRTGHAPLGGAKRKTTAESCDDSAPHNSLVEGHPLPVVAVATELPLSWSCDLVVGVGPH